LALSEYKKYVVSENPEFLIPGDLVFFSAGDMFPVDVRILDSKDLFINQSAITGESLPVEKVSYLTDAQRSLTTAFVSSSSILPNLDNICLSGTYVSSGIAIGVVISTVENSFLTNTMEFISEKNQRIGSFRRDMSKISYMLLLMTFVSIIIIFITRILTI